jgi:Mg/Co/Ni transporter MgtE
MAKNRGILVDIWDFLKVRKAWWLAPIVVMLLLLGMLIVASQTGVLAPFIYALF